MTPRVRAPILLGALLLLSASAGEDASAPEGLPLSLQDAIERALRNNLQLEVERKEPQVAKEAVEKAKSAFDPTASLSYGDKDKHTTTTSSLQGAATSQTRDATYKGGLSEKFPTGTSLDLSLAYVRSKTNSAFSTLNPSHTSTASLTVKQPLLKGFGLEANRADQTQAVHNEAAALHGFRAKLADTVSGVENAYWDLVAALDDVSVKRAALEASRALEASNQAKVDAGTLPRTDLLEASSAAASSEADLIDAERKVQDAQDVLRRLVEPPADGRAPGAWSPFRPVDRPSVPAGDPDATASIGQAFSSRPELARSRALLQSALTGRLSAEDALLPDLSLSGTWSQDGVAAERGDSYSNLSNGRARTWELLLSLEMPLGNRGPKSDARKAEAQVDQERLRLRDLEQQVVVEVRASVRALDSGRRRVEANERAVAFSSENLKAELLRFEQGLSTTHAVLDALKADTAERGRLLTAQLEFVKAFRDWQKAQGTLLESRGIRLE